MKSQVATLFPSINCSSAKEIAISWEEFFEMIKNVKIYNDKKAAPLIKLAKFGANVTAKKSLKHDANLIELYGIEGDYDAGVMTINEACTLLEKHGVRAILYTTWSSTTDKPRWRVLAPFSKSIPKESHAQMVKRLNNALGGVLAHESFTLSQGYYIGKNPNQAYTCICTFDDPNGGTCIDQLDSLDKVVSAQSTDCKVESGRAIEHKGWLNDLLAGEDIHGNALRLVGQMVSRGYDDQTICDTFEGWKDELIAARDEVRIAELFGGELLRMIQGARKKDFGPKMLENVLSDLRKFSPLELRNKWLELIVKMTPSERSIALQEVSRLSGVKIQILKQELKIRDDKIKQEFRNQAIDSRVGTRFNIVYQPENVAATADLVETKIVESSNHFEFARFAGMLVRVVIDALPMAHYADSDLPPAHTAQTDVLTKPKLLPLVERSVVFQKANENGHITNIGVPDKILEHILVNNKKTPCISAMITHPVVTSKGRIVSEIGVDHDTGLLLYGNKSLSDIKPYSEMEAVEAIGRIKSTFLNGFEFISELDKTAAIALLFTAIQRKLMPAAPGGLISAAQQSTGKTTFVKLLHIILTGRDLPVMSWSANNEIEVQKMLLATLLRSPELICFDNLTDGLTFRSPTIATAITSPFFEGRILGQSRDVSVPTSVMMCLTGNNIKLANDEVHRWIKVNLTTNNPSPHKRNFQNSDVLKHALSIRYDVLRDCLGIIAGYLQQNERIVTASRFPEWDAFVRQPLIWAWEEDVANVFDCNIEQSDEIGARGVLLFELSQYFKDIDFGAVDIINSYIQGHDFDNICLNSVAEALKILNVRDLKNNISIGRALSKLVNVPVIAPNSSPPLTLTLIRCEGTSLARYRIVKKSM